MSLEKFSCYACGAEIQAVGGRIGRSDTCDHCRCDVHACLNCIHYDKSAYNECREPMADRVVDKEKRNFCDYFKPGDTASRKVENDKDGALKKLNDLFK